MIVRAARIAKTKTSRIPRSAYLVAGLALCASLAPSCQSAPELSTRVAEGEPCRLDYYNARSARSMAIVNKSYNDPDSTPDDGTVSRVDDKAVLFLISDLERLGFFKYAQPRNPTNASDWIALRSPRGVWVYPKPRGDIEGLRRWHTCAKGFTMVWNQGYSAIGSKGYGSGKNMFDAQQNRLKKMNDRLKKRLGGGR